MHNFSKHPKEVHTQWPAQSKQQESQPVAKPQESSSLRKQPANQHLQLAVSRNLTGIDPELSPSVKSDAIRSLLSFSSASCLSNVLFVKLRKTTKRISASRDLLSWHFKSRPRPTSLAFSRTPTWPPSTPSE